MKKAFVILALVILLGAACSPPEPTAAPTASPAETLALPTREVAPTPTEAPTQEPTPAPTAPPAPTPQPSATAEAPAEDPLARYAPAMRPAYGGDLAAVGPLSRYRIEVTVDPEGPTLVGREVVHYVNDDPVAQDAVYLRLYPNLPSYGGEIVVTDLQVESRAVSGSLEVGDTALRVPLPEPLPAGGETEIALDFRVSVPQSAGVGYAQFIYSQTVMSLANFFPLIPAYDEENCARFGDDLPGPGGRGNCVQGWNVEYPVHYGDVGFSDSALFEVSVTAPAGWTVVGSGSTVGQEVGADGQVTWQMVSGPIRDFNLVLSPRYERLTETVEDIVVNSYFLPEDEAGGQRALRWAADSLAFFSERFGPYPFTEFDVAATATVAGGIEYPGLIVMPIRYYGREGGFFQLATIHEVAHQWWYSLVGNDQQDEPWLDEALAQYSTALYYEVHEGWAAAGQEMFGAWYDAVRGTHLDGAIDLPVADYEEALYGPLVYGKGPLFFDALRQEVGDATFDAILRAYFQTYRYGVADGPGLLALAEELSGQDLSTLYQVWLGDGR